MHHKTGVLHIIKASGRGGAEVLLREGYKYADKEAFEFHYMQLIPEPCEILNELRQQGASVHILKGHIYDLHSIVYGIRSIVRRHHIKIVHAHLPIAGVFMRLSCMGLPVKTVYTEHNLSNRYNRITRILNAATWMKQDAVIAISDAVARLSEQKIPRRPVHTIYNGVDVPAFKADQQEVKHLKRAMGFSDENRIIGTVTSLRNSDQKRVDIWLKACQILHQQDARYRFVLVGDGDRRSAYEKMAADLGIAAYVYFAGRVQQVAVYYQLFDYFMFSSAYEGFGVVLIEAFAAQVPVVAFDVEGVNGIIRHEHNGYLAAYSTDAAAAASSLAAMLTVAASGHTKAVADEAYQQAVAVYSMDKMQSKIERVYQKLLQQQY